MFNLILEFIYNLNAFWQAIIGTLALMLFLWLGRVFFKLLGLFIHKIKNIQEEKKIIKHVIYKYYINQNGMYYFSQGYFCAIYKAISYFLMGFIVLTLGFLMISINNNSLVVKIIIIYIALQLFLEGLSWVTLSELSKKEIEKLDKKRIKKIIKNLVIDPLKKLGMKHPLIKK